MDQTQKTVFQKIIDRELPANIRFEDDEVIVVDTIKPSAPIHLLIIPKRLIVSAAEITEADAPLVGKLFAVAAQMARALNIKNFKLIFNGGKYLHVPHLHLHLLGGDELGE